MSLPLDRTAGSRERRVDAKLSDVELLRLFEPVIRYTRGEQFFPMDVERYVEACSLWARFPDGQDELLVGQDQLTLDSLVQPRWAPFGTIHYLRFIENLSLAESADVLAREVRLRLQAKNAFHPGPGRLARGGLLPRIVDAIFSLSFILRGRVPAASAAAAELDYAQMRAQSDVFPYYGRVVRQSDWIVLQYWFFYCYNNWRTGFGGVNDHESDWEMVSVYLYEDAAQLIPEWVNYAAHDSEGDDFRRRWDDDGQLDLQDGHPVVYAGAGSHASYFRPGEYQAEVDIDLPAWVKSIRRGWNTFWTRTLGQKPADPFHIPFVDYARGDGPSIGPGQSRNWSPVLIDSAVPWVGQYRGLWGLYARDPISGENAPAGPLYNRDGSPRIAWFDPLGNAGLDKVAPPPHVKRLLEKSAAEVAERQAALEALISQKAADLQAMGVRVRSTESHPHLARQHATLQLQLTALAQEVRALRRERSENFGMLEGLRNRLDRHRRGLRDDPRAHIGHLAMPTAGKQRRFERLGEAWAAASLSLLLLGTVGLLFLAPHYLGAGLAILAILSVVVESILRSTFIQTVGEISAFLAVIACIVLVINFWYWLLAAALLAIAAFLISQRIRELTG